MPCPLPTIGAMSTFDVCVRGSGSVALSAALALGRRGWRVALAAGPGFAAAPAREDVRAYALNAASIALLQSLEGLGRAAGGRPHRRCSTCACRATTARCSSFSAWSQAVDALAWIVDAAELERALREVVRYAPHVAERRRRRSRPR